MTFRPPVRVSNTGLAALIAVRWGFNPVMVVVLNGAFLILDLIFVAANAAKSFEGGWLPVLIAGGVALLMLTWHRGARLVAVSRAEDREDEGDLLGRLAASGPVRTSAVVAFLSATADEIPLTLTKR